MHDAGKKLALLSVAVVITLVAFSALGAAMGLLVVDDWSATSGVTFNADNGPEIELGSNLEIDRQDPIPGDGSVDLRPELRVEAADGTSIRYDGQPSGLATFDDMTLSGSVDVTHETQPDITIDGTADGFAWTDPDIQSTATTDLRYHSGSLTVTMPGDTDVLVVDKSTEETIDFAQTDGQQITFTLESTGSEWRDVTLIESEGGPTIEDASASPTGEQSDKPTQLSVDVEDPDDKELVVEFELNDEQVGTDTVQGSGTATTSIGDVLGGENEWQVTVTDEYEQTATSSYTFYSPTELEIRNETSPTELVTTEAEVEVTFFTEDEVYTRTTTDGIVDLEGLPIDQEFVVQVNADGYYTREAIIRTIFDQQEVYVLADDVETVQTKFVLEDPTGQFSPDNTRVFVKRAIDTGDGVAYRTIVADELGVDGYSTVLEQDQRYVIEVENTDTGEIRSLGPYVASISEQVTLKVDTIEFSYVDEELGYQWDGQYQNDSGQESVRFSFAMTDEERQFDSLNVVIYQRGNESNVILDEGYASQNSVTDVGLIPEDVEGYENKTYIIEWEATIDGETVTGSEIVGPDQMPIGIEGVPDELMSVISVFLIIVVGGLFSVANVEIGAIVISLFSALLWFVGFLPGAVSGILIATALLLSIIMYSRRGGGGPQ